MTMMAANEAGLTELEHSKEPPAISARPHLVFRGLGLPLLLMLLLGCCLVFIRMLPNDPLLHEALTRPFRPNPIEVQARRLQLLRAKDPTLGATLPIPALSIDGTGRATNGRPSSGVHGQAVRPTVVLMIGPCSGCVLTALRNVDELFAAHPEVRVVAVSPSTSHELAEFRKSNKLRLELVSDPHSRVAERYNAAWVPRAYLISKSGSLLWLQTTGSLDAQQVLDAVRAGMPT